MSRLKNMVVFVVLVLLFTPCAMAEHALVAPHQMSVTFRIDKKLRKYVDGEPQASKPGETLADIEVRFRCPDSYPDFHTGYLRFGDLYLSAQQSELIERIYEPKINYDQEGIMRFHDVAVLNDQEAASLCVAKAKQWPAVPSLGEQTRIFHFTVGAACEDPYSDPYRHAFSLGAKVSTKFFEEQKSFPVTIYCDTKYALANVTPGAGGFMHTCPEGTHIYGTHEFSKLSSRNASDPLWCYKSEPVQASVWTGFSGGWRYECPTIAGKKYYLQGRSWSTAIKQIPPSDPDAPKWCMPFPLDARKG